MAGSDPDPDDDVAVDDGQAWPLLGEMLACLCTSLDDSPGGQPCFCGIVPAQQVAMDFCTCDSADTACGMAWVRLDSLYPTTAFPQPDTTARSCSTAFTAARIQMGVTRCLPDMDEAGNPPDVAAQMEATRIQLGDMAAMRRALDCCLTRKRRDWILGSYQPVGPSGACGGGAFMVTVKVR